LDVLREIVALVSDLLQRRRLRWVEVSVTRAWSRDTIPRLFDFT
jgi:hypothetical protein